jgi:hypothetical protein
MTMHQQSEHSALNIKTRGVVAVLKQGKKVHEAV